MPLRALMKPVQEPVRLESLKIAPLFYCFMFLIAGNTVAFSTFVIEVSCTLLEKRLERIEESNLVIRL